jgi:succinate-semialdehyde dehydrogenase/glutarate-semialdehyde dehydrogenase
MCAAVSRVIVHESIAERFSQRLIEHVQALRQGDPQLAEVDVGAMTRPGQIEFIEKKLGEAVAQGAKVLTGGKRRTEPPFGEGRFFEPTVLAGVTPEMGVWREELFGPVISVVSYRDEEEAVRLANDTDYGLQGHVFGRKAHAEAVARRVRAGSVIVNDVLYNHGCPEVPWGGLKQSGIGRVHGDAALRDFCEIRHVGAERVGIVLPQLLFPYSQKTYALIKKAGRALLARGLWGKLRAMLGGA